MFGASIDRPQRFDLAHLPPLQLMKHTSLTTPIAASTRAFQNSAKRFSKAVCAPFGAAAVLLGSLSIDVDAQITLDGVLSVGDNYSNSTLVTYFNGHDDTYGDFENQTYQTLVYYGTGTLAGDDSGTEYFFVLAEAPIQIKNMVWGDGMTESDIAAYGTDMDFSKATGSEELNLLDSDGGEILTVDLGSNLDGGGGKKSKGGTSGEDIGFIDFKDSADFLIDNGLATFDSSSASTRTMSYEMRFALDSDANQEVIDALENGIDFHLSPDRGQNGIVPPAVVPEPSAALLIGAAGMLCLLRRRR